MSEKLKNNLGGVLMKIPGKKTLLTITASSVILMIVSKIAFSKKKEC